MSEKIGRWPGLNIINRKLAKKSATAACHVQSSLRKSVVINAEDLLSSPIEKCMIFIKSVVHIFRRERVQFSVLVLQNCRII